eukprot:PhF_6_TR19919/c0_g1_i3/m.28962
MTHRVLVTESHLKSLTSGDTRPMSSMVIFSGGSGMHGLIGPLREDNKFAFTFVLPITDDGGSTSEILRVLGGPAVGDVRNLLVRIAKDRNPHDPCMTILSSRLNGESRVKAKEEFMTIMNGTHTHVQTSSYSHVLQAFLNVFYQSVNRTTFDFRYGSVGNFFLTGARLFFNSFGAAIVVCSRILQIPQYVKVVPVVDADLPQTGLTLRCEFQDGTKLNGQTVISYGTRSDVVKDTAFIQPLPSWPKRLEYVTKDSEHTAMTPVLHDDVTRSLRDPTLKIVLYGRGSLVTSLCAILVVPGLGDVIRSLQHVKKVLLVNSVHDRETTTQQGSFTVCDVIKVVFEALVQSSASTPLPSLPRDVCQYITDVVYVDQGDIQPCRMRSCAWCQANDRRRGNTTTTTISPRYHSVPGILRPNAKMSQFIFEDVMLLGLLNKLGDQVVVPASGNTSALESEG